MPVLAALLLLGQSAWKSYPLGGMILDLPAAPKSVTPEGGNEKSWISVGADKSVVSISFGTIKDFDPVQSVGWSLMGAVNEMAGEFIGQTDLVLNGWPGIEGTIKVKDLGITRFRAYRVADRLFTLTVIAKDPKVSERAFKSIAFAPRFGAGELKQAGPTWTRANLDPFPGSAEFPGITEKAQVANPDFPSSPIRRLQCKYGVRSYVAAFTNLKPEQIATEEARKQTIATDGDLFQKGTHGKIVNRKPSSLAGSPSERIESTVDENFTVYSETTIVEDRLYILAAIVPKPLKNSPELAYFFNSFKLP